MTAKTYGQVLKDALTDDPEIGRLLFVPDESFEQCARAVILEFVRRVEEEALQVSYSNIQADADAECWHLSAFRKLAAELKEAK